MSGTPQFAGTFGVRYFIDYWFLGANLNAFGRNYIDVAPARRMEGIYNTVDPTLPETMDTYYAMTTQERIGSACTLDLSVGFSTCATVNPLISTFRSIMCSISGTFVRVVMNRHVCLLQTERWLIRRCSLTSIIICRVSTALRTSVTASKQRTERIL